MTIRTISGLVLAAALSLPVIAQESTTSAPASSPSQPAATDQQKAQQPATATTGTSDQASQGERKPLEYQRREGFWGKMNPFARKKYVRRQLDPVRDRVNELDELTAANSKQIKDVDGRATEGIRLASAKATEADQHAVDAGNRAQLAHQTASQATERLQTVQTAVNNIDQFQLATQAEIRFRPGQSVLSKRAKDALDELATPLKAQKGYIIEVQGFSSGTGQAAIASSQRMAESVVRYLVLQHEIPVFRVFTVGMGNAPVATSSGKVRRTNGGRVEISLLKNGISDLDVQPIQAGSNVANGSSTSAGSAPAQALPQSDQNGAASTTTPPAQPPAEKQEPKTEEKPKN